MNKSLQLAIVIIGNLVAATGFWVVYCFAISSGWLAAVLSFFALSFCYKLGPAALFIVSATLLHFKFDVVGLWLPITSYILGAFMAAIQFQMTHRQSSAAPNDSAA